jgi:hypothetical protein
LVFAYIGAMPRYASVTGQAQPQPVARSIDQILAGPEIVLSDKNIGMPQAVLDLFDRRAAFVRQLCKCSAAIMGSQIVSADELNGGI